VISLREYGSSIIALDKKDLAYLLDLIKVSGAPDEPKLFESISPTREDGIYAVRPGPFVGRLGLPSGEVLDISSRFAFRDVVSLIRLSGRSPIRIDSLQAAAGETEFIIDLIATAFGREVERIVGNGLAKGYVQRRFVRPPYPGTLDIGYWIGHQSARSDRLATRASRLTVSILVNQILAAALDALSSVPLSPQARGKLAAVMPAFGAIQRGPVTWSDAANVRLTRLTLRYREALALAERILRAKSLSFSEGGLAGASIVFSMPKVWESCVSHWAEGTWGKKYRVVPGYPFHVTSGGEITGYADVLVLDGERPVALYDAKYKDIEKAPSPGDVYQMVTYCERLGLQSATLAYPAAFSASEVQVGRTIVRVVGIRDVVETLA